MFCKWCGLESETSDVCSWCRRPFSATASSQKVQEAVPKREPSPEEETSIIPSQAVRSAPPPPSAPATGPHMLGIDEDLNPLPFTGPISVPVTPAQPRREQPTGPTPLAQSVPPPSPQPPIPATRPVSPEAPPIVSPKTPTDQESPATETPSLPSKPTPAPPYRPPAPRPSPPSYTPPPASPPRGGAGYTFAQPRQPADSRPPLEPIPIKGAKPPPTAPTPPAPTTRPEAPPSPGPAHPIPSGPTPPIQRTPPSRPALPINITPSAPPSPRPGAMPLGDIPPDVPAPPATPEKTVEMELGLQPLAKEQVPDVAPAQAPGMRRYDLGSEPPGAPTPQTHATAHTATVPRTGMGVYCRWCGMMSETRDICSWCKKDLRLLHTVHPTRITTTRHAPPPSKRGPVRQPLYKPPAGAVPLNHAEPSTQAAAAPVTVGVPQIGTFQAQKSKYYGDKVLDPVSGAHYDADTGQTTDVPVERLETEEVNLWIQVPINLAVLALLTLASVLVVRAFPGIGTYLSALFVANVMAGMAMPVLRVVPYNSDDATDLPLVIALILILGPFAGGMLYGIICFLKQDANPAMVGVFISYLVLRIALDITMGYPFEHLLPFANLHWTGFAAQWMPLATVLGWIGADPFRKPDE